MTILDLAEQDHSACCEELRSRFLGLALDAYRREEISRGKLRELAASVGVYGDDLTALLEVYGLHEDEPSAVLLPEGFE